MYQNSIFISKIKRVGVKEREREIQKFCKINDNMLTL